MIPNLLISHMTSLSWEWFIGSWFVALAIFQAYYVGRVLIGLELQSSSDGPHRRLNKSKN